jgi:hypothetical protein
VIIPIGGPGVQVSHHEPHFAGRVAEEASFQQVPYEHTVIKGSYTEPYNMSAWMMGFYLTS